LLTSRMSNLTSSSFVTSILFSSSGVNAMGLVLGFRLFVVF
jgi:hypothetical protein